jgi:predicted phage gp36 major capsid-like protein
VLLRRLSDLLMEQGFIDVQMQVVAESVGPHKPRDVALRLAALRQRAEALDDEVRARARDMGEDCSKPMSELRGRLSARHDRRRGPDPSYQGPERRRGPRRARDAA